MNIPPPSARGRRPHGSIATFVPTRRINILNFLVFHDKKNRPAPWAVKMFFFRVQQMERFWKGFGLLIVFQRFGLNKLDISWFHFRNWISFVADTKMRKTTSEVKIFRPTIVFARRKSKIPDEGCEDNKSISRLFNFTPRSTLFSFSLFA